MANRKQKKIKSVKKNQKKKAGWLIFVTSFLILTTFIFIFFESSKEVNDLSLIGKGENIIVQVHDPG